jgi:hypothetical protein
MEEILVFTAGERGPYHVKERSKENFKNGSNDITKIWKDLIKEISYKVIENDLEANLKQDDEVPMHPKECIVNSIAEEKMSKNENEADGEHSEKGEDMQRENYEKNEEETMEVTMTNTGYDESINLGTMLQEKENMIEELKAKLEESQTAFKELKEEIVVYKTESQTNERTLTEELDIMRSELRELRTNNSKLLSQAEYNEERVKILSANTCIYKSQITALEEKNKTCNLTVVKHEQTIMHLKDAVLVNGVWKI